MEHVSEIVSMAALGVLVGLMGVLINRRRQHLRLVVRVVDDADQNLMSFLDQLVQSGQLTPVPVH